MDNLEIFLILNKPVGSFIQTTSKWANLNLFPNSWLSGPGLFRRWHLCVPQGLGLLRYSLEVSVNKIYEKLIKTELKMETKVYLTLQWIQNICHMGKRLIFLIDSSDSSD